MNIGQRYNPHKLFHGSFIPNWLLKRTEISARSKLVFARLSQYAGKDGECFPLQATIAEECGISLQWVNKSISELTSAKLIENVRNGLGKPNSYFFLWHEWSDEGISRKVDGCTTEIQTDVQQDTLTGVNHSMKRINEENHNKRELLIPNELSKYVGFNEHWRKWIDYLNKRKKKPTEYTLELHIKKLVKFEKMGQNPVDVINQAIERSWQSLFELKDYPQNSGVYQTTRVAPEISTTQIIEEKRRREAAKIR